MSKVNSRSLPYTLIAYKNLVLCEYSFVKGSFLRIAKQVIRNIDANKNTKLSYQYDEYFSIIRITSLIIIF